MVKRQKFEKVSRDAIPLPQVSQGIPSLPHFAVRVLWLCSRSLVPSFRDFRYFASPEDEFFSILFLMILAHTALSEEAKARLEAMQQAIANCRIEGMELPPDDSAYLEELIADDSLTADQRLERMFAHIVGNPSDAR